MKKVRTINSEIVINSTKENVWDLLFNRFGEVNNFNPLIEGSQSVGEVSGEVGAERTCDISANSKVHERISDVRGTESFDIEILEGGLPMMDKMDATWELKQIGQEKTKAILHFSYTTKPAFMGSILKRPMVKSLNGMIVGLKYYLETGGLVTKKNIKKIVREYKKLQAEEAFSAPLDLAIAA